ncbi:MAG: hypothetical protein IPH13_17280 [Planctomycetes bacterium]|nr:hypothetical protein [Planctomycetota bacterium]MCC7171604.1 hypothetical protein [Planctomycetota bacterium]
MDRSSRDVSRGRVAVSGVVLLAVALSALGATRRDDVDPHIAVTTPTISVGSSVAKQSGFVVFVGALFGQDDAGHPAVVRLGTKRAVVELKTADYRDLADLLETASRELVERGVAAHVESETRHALVFPSIDPELDGELIAGCTDAGLHSQHGVSVADG